MGETVYLKKFGSDKLEQLLSSFENHLKEDDLARSSKSYLGDIRRFFQWFSERESFNPVAVTKLDIIDYRDYLQKFGGRKGNGAAPSTVNRALISLRVFFKWLEKNGRIPENPAEDIKSVAVSTPTAPKWLDRKEQAALVRVISSSRDKAIIGLMLHAGLRVSEVSLLKREDVFISDRKGHVTVRLGKGNKYRQVPLNKTIRNILSGWIKENPEGPLFPNRYGKPISPRGIFKLVSEYAYQAKIEATPHTLRHTFCKEALKSMTLNEVAMLAGHSSLDITKRYVTPSEDDLQRAVERMAWE